MISADAFGKELFELCQKHGVTHIAYVARGEDGEPPIPSFFFPKGEEYMTRRRKAEGLYFDLHGLAAQLVGMFWMVGDQPPTLAPEPLEERRIHVPSLEKMNVSDLAKAMRGDVSASSDNPWESGAEEQFDPNQDPFAPPPH